MGEVLIMYQGKEQGFTLIELMYVVIIISILSATSFQSFVLYMEKAEFSKAEADLHNSILSVQQGELDVPATYSIAYSLTGQDGGKIDGPMATILPHAKTSKGVQIGVSYSSCATALDTTPAVIISSEACKINKKIVWTRFCGGLVTRVTNDASPGCS